MIARGSVKLEPSSKRAMRRKLKRRANKQKRELGKFHCQPRWWTFNP